MQVLIVLFGSLAVVPDIGGPRCRGIRLVDCQRALCSGDDVRFHCYRALCPDEKGPDRDGAPEFAPPGLARFLYRTDGTGGGRGPSIRSHSVVVRGGPDCTDVRSVPCQRQCIAPRDSPPRPASDTFMDSNPHASSPCGLGLGGEMR